MAQKKKQPAKSATKKAPAKKTAAKQPEPRSGSAEIVGVILIGLGVLLGIYLYINPDGMLGTFLNSAFFITCGFVAYALPVMFFILGMIAIANRKKDRIHGSAAVIILTIVLVIAFVHAVFNIPYQDKGENIKLLDYYDSVIHLAQEQRQGGGVIGGTICYLLQIAGGNVLCWVVIASGLIVCILLLTRFSIKAFAVGLKENVEHLRDHEPADEPARQQIDATPAPRATAHVRDAAPPAKTLTFETLLSDGKTPQKPVKKRKKDVEFDLIVPEAEPVAKPKRKPAPVPADEIIPVSHIGRTVTEPPQKRTVKASFDDLVPFEDVFSIPEKPPVKAPAAAARPAAAKKQAEPAPLKPPAARPDAYVPPAIDCLNESVATYGKSAESPVAKARLLEETLMNFKIEAHVVNTTVGPVVTRFELQPAPGVRINRITTLSNDIALALAAPRVRIEAPIPGKAAIGIEIPNTSAQTVLLRDIIESREFIEARSAVTMALGKDIGGKIITADLSKMPHMLIAGSTGSGKSVCINDIIVSMIYKSSPEDLKLILIDPKKVELSVFGTLPHLLIPVVTNPKKAAGALNWAVNEMDNRYVRFSEQGARDLARYNELQKTPETKFPKIVIIIDELADLMMVTPDEVEEAICRVAQLGRAAGIHLIVATQRPSADIITGLIKANIPSRCAFAVSSALDSRIILDESGAEKLLGRGDMLFHPNGAGKPTRLQCALVSDEEIERVTAHFRVKKEEPQFDQKIIDDMNAIAKGEAVGGVFGKGKQEDDLLGEALRVVLDNGQASTSMLQRRLRVGYARASRLIDIMEQHKYVSGFEGSKPRRVLIKRAEYERLYGDGSYIPADGPDDGGDEPEDVIE